MTIRQKAMQGVRIAGLVGIDDVTRIAGLKDYEVLNLCRLSEFPKPQRLKVGVDVVKLWQLEDVEAWAARFIAAQGEFWKMRPNQEMTLHEVMELLGLEFTILRAMINAGEFNAPFTTRSAKERLWKRQDVIEWREGFFCITELVQATGLTRFFIDKKIQVKQFPRPDIKRKGVRLWKRETVAAFVQPTNNGGAV